MSSFLKSLVDVDLKGATLVLPALSIGNVPQLSVDLWVNARKLPRVGLVASSHLSAACGYGYYNDRSCLGTAGELYFEQASNTAILQLRAPVLANHVLLFVRELKEWVESVGVSRVLLLSSADVMFLEHPDAPHKLRHVLKGWDALRERLGAAESRELQFDKPNSESMRGEVVTPRSTTDLLLRELPSVCALFLFCSEGENVPESRALLQVAHRLVYGEAADAEQPFQPPASWMGLFV